MKSSMKWLKNISLIKKTANQKEKMSWKPVSGIYKSINQSTNLSSYFYINKHEHNSIAGNERSKLHRNVYTERKISVSWN